MSTQDVRTVRELGGGCDRGRVGPGLRGVRIGRRWGRSGRGDLAGDSGKEPLRYAEVHLVGYPERRGDQLAQQT